MKSKLPINLVRVLILVGVIALTIYLYTIRDQVAKLQGYGYVGIFLISIIANATIIIPLPGIVLTSAMGMIFNPLGVAIAAGSGAALGELTGYMAGFSGQGVVEKTEKYQRLLSWMEKHPRWTNLAIFGLALIPNPLFDMAGMASGALKIPVWRFLLMVWFGKILKMLPFAYAGAPIMKYLTNLLEQLKSIR